MQLISGSASIIGSGENVLFDSTILHRNQLIRYEPLNGVFTVRRAGTYMVSWSVATSECPSGNDVAFAIRVNDVIYSKVVSPVANGLISGSTLVQVTSNCATISLANVSGNNVILAATSVQANAVITRV